MKTFPSKKMCCIKVGNQFSFVKKTELKYNGNGRDLGNFLLRIYKKKYPDYQFTSCSTCSFSGTRSWGGGGGGVEWLPGPERPERGGRC